MKEAPWQQHDALARTSSPATAPVLPVNGR
jgi:hypothetical protein